MTTLEALASRVDVYSIDEAFLDLTGIDRVVSFEPFGRQAIWLKVESPDGYRKKAFSDHHDNVKQKAKTPHKRGFGYKHRYHCRAS